jgi:cell division protein FtsB
LSALTGEQRKRDMLEQNSKEISTNLVGLEKEMSKLKVERDMTMAEMAELKRSVEFIPDCHATWPLTRMCFFFSPITAGLDTHSFEATGTRLSKALSVRFDGIKSQYKRQLEPLTEQREGLMREINELSESRKAILEETAALHARNEELMGLNSQLSRNIENQVFQQSTSTASELFPSGTPPAPPAKSFSASTSSYSDENSRTLRGRPMDSVDHNRGGLFKWSSKTRELATPVKSESNSPGPMGMNGFQKAIKFVPHAFQQMALLRVSRCDHCNDKMWGSQSRCQGVMDDCLMLLMY